MNGDVTLTEALLVVTNFVAGVGLGGVAPVVVQILKRLNLVKDNYGGTAATLVNLLIFVALTFAVNVFGFELEGDAAQQLFAIIAQLAALIGMILTSLGGFKVMRNAEVYGFRKSKL